MDFITNYISRYLSKLLFIPCLLLALIISFDLVKALHDMGNNAQTYTNVSVSKVAFNLVHELQKERGLTAGFLGSQTQQARSALLAQRQQVDNANQALTQILQKVSLPQELDETVNTIKKKLSQLAGKRAQIDNLQLSLTEALQFYQIANTQTLNMVLVAAKTSNSKEVIRALTAIYNLSSAMENAGVESAVLMNVFSADHMSTKLRARLIRLATQQKLFFNYAINMAPKQMAAAIKQAQQERVFKEVEEYLKLTRGRNKNFNVVASDWFTTANKRIDRLRSIEDDALQNILELALKAKQHTQLLLIVGILLFALGFTLTIFLFLAVKQTQKQSKEIEEGIHIAADSKDLKHHIAIITSDELGRAAKNINLLINQFHQDLMTFQQHSESIQYSVNLSVAAIDNNQKALDSLDSFVHRIASSAEELQSSIESVAQAIKENALCAEQAATESLNSQENVNKSVALIADTSNQMRASVAQLDKVNGQVEDISAMVSVINGIADQTNLLALNAAIEAARAGEQGRGFAVVADEVRSLANRTQQVTEDISSLVNNLLSNAGQLAKTMTGSQQQADEAASEAERVNHSLHNIVALIQDVKNSAQRVEHDTQGQQTAIANVAKGVIQVSDDASSSVQENSEVLKLITEIKNKTEEMNTVIAMYKA